MDGLSTDEEKLRAAEAPDGDSADVDPVDVRATDPDIEMTEPDIDFAPVGATAAGHRRRRQGIRDVWIGPQITDANSTKEVSFTMTGTVRPGELETLGEVVSRDGHKVVLRVPEHRLREVVTQALATIPLINLSVETTQVSRRTPAKRLTPGIIVAERYRVVRFIASGGMAAVYEAEDRVLGSAVALKIMLPDFVDDEDARVRFRHEALLARKVTHTGVCRVFDVGAFPDGAGGELQFMTMELLSGDTLSERIRKLGKLPAAMALRIAEQVAAALDAAHGAGIIHRDLKSGNILLVEQADGGARAVVMDFGIAATEQDPTALDQTGEILGTFGYMSPEQARAEPATRASDIYAFGVVLHEMRTGRLPNRPGQPTTIAGRRTTFDRVMQGAPVRLEPGWELGIQRCLEEDPAARWPSASAVISCLRGEQRTPYRGLFAFEGDDRHLFFGRAAEIQEILDRLRDQAVVVVAGDSGVGKSSICRAGVVPQILDGAVGGPIAWRIATVIPGRSPVTAVRDVVRMLRRYEALADTAPYAGDLSFTSELLRATTRESGLLLFIDQLEELATMSEPEEAAHLAQTIGRVAAAPVPGLRILATVRSDLLGNVAALDGIREMLSRSLYVLPHLGRAQLREAIVQPANLYGVRFDPPEMVDLLIARAGSPVNLPLLQFTMSELWRARDVASGKITPRVLEAIGGVEGALARHADGVIARLLPTQRPLARRILCRLVTTSRRVARRTESELDQSDSTAIAASIDETYSMTASSSILCEGSSENREVLDELIRGGLVVVDEAEGKTVYALAHEALVHHWQTLRDWLNKADEGTKSTAPAPAPAPTQVSAPAFQVGGSRRHPTVVIALSAIALIAALVLVISWVLSR